jgi:hypothetical protein
MQGDEVTDTTEDPFRGDPVDSVTSGKPMLLRSSRASSIPHRHQKRPPTARGWGTNGNAGSACTEVNVVELGVGLAHDESFLWEAAHPWNNQQQKHGFIKPLN